MRAPVTGHRVNISTACIGCVDISTISRFREVSVERASLSSRSRPRRISISFLHRAKILIPFSVGRIKRFYPSFFLLRSFILFHSDIFLLRGKDSTCDFRWQFRPSRGRTRKTTLPLPMHQAWLPEEGRAVSKWRRPDVLLNRFCRFKISSAKNKRADDKRVV